MKPLALLLVAASAFAADGIRWEKDLDAARAAAAKEGKLVLRFVLLGDLTAEDC